MTKLTPKIKHSHPQRNPNFFNRKVCSSTISHRQMAPKIQFIHTAQLKFNKSILKFKLYPRNKFAKHKSQISRFLLKCKHWMDGNRTIYYFQCVCVFWCVHIYITTQSCCIWYTQGTVAPLWLLFLRKGLFVRFCLSAFRI